MNAMINELDSPSKLIFVPVLQLIAIVKLHLVEFEKFSLAGDQFFLFSFFHNPAIYNYYYPVRIIDS